MAPAVVVQPERAVTLGIAGVVDFDPVSDGGSGSENPGAVRLAVDHSDATAWTTLTYFDRPDLGGLKPGVGLVVDLGTAHRLQDVTLVLTGAGTDLEIRTAGQGPQPTTADGFAEVARATGVGSRVTLTPDRTTRARWLLIWLTRLPAVGPGQYQGGIASIVVRGYPSA